MIGSQVTISSNEMFKNRGSDHVLYGSSMGSCRSRQRGVQAHEVSPLHPRMGGLQEKYEASVGSVGFLIIIM